MPGAGWSSYFCPLGRCFYLDQLPRVQAFYNKRDLEPSRCFRAHQTDGFVLKPVSGVWQGSVSGATLWTYLWFSSRSVIAFLWWVSPFATLFSENPLTCLCSVPRRKSIHSETVKSLLSVSRIKVVLLLKVKKKSLSLFQKTSVRTQETMERNLFLEIPVSFPVIYTPLLSSLLSLSPLMLSFSPPCSISLTLFFPSFFFLHPGLLSSKWLGAFTTSQSLQAECLE